LIEEFIQLGVSSEELGMKKITHSSILIPNYKKGEVFK